MKDEICQISNTQVCAQMIQSDSHNPRNQKEKITKPIKSCLAFECLIFFLILTPETECLN